MAVQHAAAVGNVVKRTVVASLAATVLVTLFGACGSLTAPKCQSAQVQAEPVNPIVIGTVPVSCKR